MNCSSDLKNFENFRSSASNFKSFSWSLEYFFLKLGQNKIPFQFCSWSWKASTCVLFFLCNLSSSNLKFCMRNSHCELKKYTTSLFKRDKKFVKTLGTWFISSYFRIQGVSYWNVIFELALRGRRTNNFVELLCLVALGGVDIWVSYTSL